MALLAAPAGAAENHPYLSQKTINERIAPKVAAIRGLEFREPVAFRTMSRAEAKAHITSLVDEEMRADRLEDYRRILVYLGLVEPGLELRSAVIEAASRGVAAFYNERDKYFAVIVDKDFPTGLDAMTAAHELVHALQDQHFDLAGLKHFYEENDDALLALSALLEGDACDAMLRFQFNAEGRNDPLPGDHWRLMTLGVPSQAVPGLPTILERDMLFPYTYGSRFVSALIEAGGPAAVDRVFRDPPVSTEQIIDPRKYLTRDEPSIVKLPDISDVLGDKWRLLAAEPIGQFNLSIFLATHLGEWGIDEAVTGWDGDVLAGWGTEDGDLFVAFYSTWDSPDDAREFFAAGDRLAVSRLAGAEEAFRGDGLVTRVRNDRLCYLALRGVDVLYVENLPLEVAGAVVARLWDARKAPFGVVRPVADRDRKHDGDSR